jgi:hypothetical protein
MWVPCVVRKEKITYPMEKKNQNVLQKQILLNRLSK